MESDNNFMDLVYFGYDNYDEESKKSLEYQKEFMDTLSERFPGVKFKDAYDNIKGFRQEVILPETRKNEYYSWILAFGWLDFSLGMSLIAMSPEKREEFKTLIDLAKKEYPQNFKS